MVILAIVLTIDWVGVGVGARVDTGRPVWMLLGFISRLDLGDGGPRRERIGFWVVSESRANVIC